MEKTGLFSSNYSHIEIKEKKKWVHERTIKQQKDDD